VSVALTDRRSSKVTGEAEPPGLGTTT